MKSCVRERLLDVAERLFADRGFHGVGVREIVAEAGANLASVGYYFGSKKGLYLAVFKERFLSRARRVLDHLRKELAGARTPKDVIEAWAASVIMGPMEDEERVLHYRLLARELTEPTEAFSIVMEEGLSPILREVEAALRRVGCEGELGLKILSVLSQIMLFNFARPIVSSVLKREYSEEFKREIVRHICEFSYSSFS